MWWVSAASCSTSATAVVVSSMERSSSIGCGSGLSNGPSVTQGGYPPHVGRTRPASPERGLTPGVPSIGLASLLSDAGHEVPTSLLPSFLTATLGAPASALGLIEGIADGASGIAKLAGGALA